MISEQREEIFLTYYLFPLTFYLKKTGPPFSGQSFFIKQIKQKSCN